MRVPRSQRGGEVIEPLVREQWFVRMQPLAEPALKVALLAIAYALCCGLPHEGCICLPATAHHSQLTLPCASPNEG